MGELKLKQLHRGYVLTDFENNEIGIKDSEQAIDEIKKLLNFEKRPDEKRPDEKRPDEKRPDEKRPDEKRPDEKRPDEKRPKPLTRTSPKIERQSFKEKHLELRKKVLEKAKEQISISGKINGAQIARDLGENVSTIHSHLRKLDFEIREFVEKWRQKQEEGEQEKRKQEEGEQEKRKQEEQEQEKRKQEEQEQEKRKEEEQTKKLDLKLIDLKEVAR